MQGNYSVEDKVVTFTVTSMKGDSEQMKSLFASTIKFSKSGKDLMLISDNNADGDVFIYNLYKSGN